MRKTRLAVVALVALSPNFANSQASVTDPNYIFYPDTWVIQRDLSDFSRIIRRNYDKFITYITPNGGTIPLLASSEVSEEQLIRAFNILDFYLTNVPQSEFGTNKANVADAMAANGAQLVMPNGADGDCPIWSWALQGQPLYQLEFPVEGSSDYMENNFERRDAGFEEIFHMVHDYGIGTRDTDGALKNSYQKEIASASQDALENGRWGIATDENVNSWVEELRAEGSIQQE